MKEFLTYEQALNFIHTRSRVGSQVNLSRMERLLSLLGDPQEGMSFVHIAGTNGKGSVTAMTAEILQRAGYKTGRYVSPFVLDFRERMMVNGRMISKEELLTVVNRVAPFVRRMEEEGTPPTEFETVTAAAFCYFADQRCDVVCLEVGLGGKADSTNVIRSPLCCAITSIGLDHTAILGDTIEQIAAEKAGILKSGCPVVCGASLSPEALGVVYEKAARLQCRVIFPSRARITLQSMDIDGTCFTYGEKVYRTSLIGVHQMLNAVTVLEICGVLRGRGMNIPDSAIETGLQETRFPARMQVLCREPLVILDGGHNPQGVSSLAESMKTLGVPKAHLVTAFMKDKDSVSCVERLLEIAASVQCVSVEGMPRSLSAGELAERFFAAAKKLGKTLPVLVSQTLRQAVDAAKARCRKGEAVLICGSLYLAAQMLSLDESK